MVFLTKRGERMDMSILKVIVTTVIAQSGIIGIITAAIMKKLKKDKIESQALYMGVQAILRHELYALYTEYYCRKKYAPVYVKEDFENMYKWYHTLGANGVMDGIHEQFQKLPTRGDEEDE